MTTPADPPGDAADHAPRVGRAGIAPSRAPTGTARSAGTSGAGEVSTFTAAAQARVACAQGAADRPGAFGLSGLTPMTDPGSGATATSGESRRRIGRYLLGPRLGRGGMASVFRAHDPTIGRDVALKFLHASLAEDEECRARFLREARAAGALSHPNIVTVHDVGEIGGRPCMAMELIEGASLADVLAARGMLPSREVALIGVQLARALDYAHARGIVHRDIKPGNILLLRDGRIKVTDFGIAHMDDGTRLPPQEGAVIGTPHYMSPEQARGEQPDGRSDLFSTGIVLYQMLCGERPFEGEGLQVLAERITRDPAPPLGAKRPAVPPALRRVVERCLAKTADERYASGQELAIALQRAIDEFDRADAGSCEPAGTDIGSCGPAGTGRMPLAVKSSLVMGVVVATVMSLAAAWVVQRQQAALLQQASDDGAALARLIATQNAAATLGERWALVDTALQEIGKTRQFERLAVIDGTGIVRACTEPAQVGRRYSTAPGRAPGGTAPGGVAVWRHSVAGHDVLDVEAPIVWRERQIGLVALGIAEGTLAERARRSAWLVGSLVLVAVLTTMIATYFLARRFPRPVGRASGALREVARGRPAPCPGTGRGAEPGEFGVASDAVAQASPRPDTRDAAAPPPPPRS